MRSWVAKLSIQNCLMLGLLVAFLSTDVRSEQLQVGVGRRVITPNPLLPVSGGMGPTAPATEKRGELEARAIVYRSGPTTVAFVALDLLGFPSVLCDRVRSQTPGIPPANILVGSTHTHSAPDCYAFPLPSGGSTGDLKYMQLVCEKAAEAVNQALDNLQPATLKIASDRAAERIAYNYYAPQLYDPRMAVIQTQSLDGAVIGTLVNYAIHPEVLGSDAGVTSPDCIGPMCDQLEQKLGGMAMFMNGAQGGMVTADNRDTSQPAVWTDQRCLWLYSDRSGFRQF